MTRAKPPPTLYTVEAISEGQQRRADGGRSASADSSIPPPAEPTGPISPSRPPPISTDLDTAPTESGSPRPPAFTIGTIPIYHTADGDNSTPPSDGNESGTTLGSSTISTDTMVHIQPGGELLFLNTPGGSTEVSWESGGGKQTPPTDDASGSNLHAPPEKRRSSRRNLHSSITQIWGDHDTLYPVQQHLSAFCSQLADTVDGLTADVLTLGSESRSTEKDASPTNIHALLMQAVQMIKDSAQMMKEVRAEVTTSKLETARFQETARLEMVDIERRALNIERIAKDQEILRMQIVDGRMDSLPDEETV